MQLNSSFTQNKTTALLYKIYTNSTFTIEGKFYGSCFWNKVWVEGKFSWHSVLISKGYSNKIDALGSNLSSMLHDFHAPWFWSPFSVVPIEGKSYVSTVVAFDIFFFAQKESFHDTVSWSQKDTQIKLML